MRLAKKHLEVWKEYESHILNQGLSYVRIKKLCTMYNMVNEHINKKLYDLTKEDLMKLVDDLNRNKIRKSKDKPYSGSTKSDLKKFIKQYFKWKYGESKYFPERVAWISSKIRKEEKPIVKDTLDIIEVVKLANCFNRMDYRLATLILFDSGFRIQELMSVKKKDLTWENCSGDQKIFWIKCNKSKTFTRKIPLPLFTEEIKLFMNSGSFIDLKKDDLIFNFSYRYFVQAIKNHSNKLFNKPITPHHLRHSSATYFAKEHGNMIALCDRYGWGYNSDEPKLYIRQSGASQRQLAKQVIESNYLSIKEENQELKKRLLNLEKNFKEIQKIILTKKHIK